jgi:hypothetical protein
MVISTCPLCGSSFIVDPNVKPVAFKRETGEPVAICRQCTRAVMAARRSVS